MGTFIGHTIPGTFFFIFGLWWATQVMRRHFLCRQTGQRFRSTATFPFACCPGQRMRDFPVESIIKMVACGVGIIGEITAALNNKSHGWDATGNAQHITMYFFFAMSGVLDLLTLKNLAPRGSDYVGMIVALLVEGTLFKFHLFGRSELDVLIHTLLLYLIWFSIIVVALEAGFRNSAVLPMMRSLVTMIQGTWFWGLGFILYNPVAGAKPWDTKANHSLMLAVLSFVIHVAVNFILLLVIGGITGCCYRNRLHYSKLDTVPLQNFADGESNGGVQLLHDEEEGVALCYRDNDNSDLEFEAPIRK